MHLFDTSDPGVVAARKQFYITLAVLAVGTYIVAGLAFWIVRSQKRDQDLVAKQDPVPNVEKRGKKISQSGQSDCGGRYK
jgi:hypothetical protein